MNKQAIKFKKKLVTTNQVSSSHQKTNKHAENFTLITKYMQLNGISRYEEIVAEKFRTETKKYGVEYLRDGLGSIIAHFPKAKGPKILLAGHLDEIGYVLLDLYDNGQARVSSVGGIWPTAVVGAKVELVTVKNKSFLGVLGHTSVHILPAEKRNVAMKETDLFVDFGFKSKAEAIEAGLEPGDPIYLKSEPFMLQNGLFAGKAIDNRIAMAVLEKLIVNVCKIQLPNNPYFVGNVQEEVGCRGAKTVAKMIDADVAIAIDTCASHDTTGSILGVCKVNDGVAIALKDYYNLIDPRLVHFLTELAKKHKIPYVKYVSQGGGTDASELQYSNKGTPTLIVSMPQRYLHSPLGVASLNDFENVVQLLTEFLKAFDSKALESLVYK